MSKTELLEQLNTILSLEYAGVVQYMQNSFLVTGCDRVVFSDFFRKQSNDALKHASLIGDKIVALGGVPTIEPATIKQSTNLTEMLEQALKLEREALAAYMTAWDLASADKPLRFMLESIIQQEQMHVEEMEKIVSSRTVAVQEKIAKHG